MLTTKEVFNEPYYGEFLTGDQYGMFRVPQVWGFDPTIISNTLTDLNNTSLLMLAQSIEMSTGVTRQIDGPFNGRVTLYVANSFAGLGARHAIILRGGNNKVGAIYYSYWTNNPDFHLSWHVFYDELIAEPSLRQEANVLTTLARLFNGDPTHVKQST